MNAFAVLLFQVIRKGVAVDFPAVNGGIPICKDFLKVPKSFAPKFTCKVKLSVEKVLGQLIWSLTYFKFSATRVNVQEKQGAGSDT